MTLYQPPAVPCSPWPIITANGRVAHRPFMLPIHWPRLRPVGPGRVRAIIFLHTPVVVPQAAGPFDSIAQIHWRRTDDSLWNLRRPWVGDSTIDEQVAAKSQRSADNQRRPEYGPDGDRLLSLLGGRYFSRLRDSVLNGHG